MPANETPFATIAADPSDPQTLYVLAPSEGLGNVFVLKTTPDARTVDYLAIIGGSGSDVVHKVHVDRLGRAWITGLTSSIDFPVVAGAPMPTYGGGGRDGFVAAIGITGDSLDFSTFAGGPGRDRVSGATLDSEDRLWAVLNSQITENGSFIAKNVLHSYGLSAASTETPFNLDRGGNFDLDLEVDGQGRIWSLAGTFCTSPFCRPEESFLQVTDATGQRLAAGVLNEGVALALDQQGAAWVAGQGTLGITPVDPKEPTRAVGYLAQFRLIEAASSPALGAVVQAAGFLGRPLVPGSIVSLFGEGLGPEQGSSFEIVDGSVLSATGSRVFFGNDEATVLYAQSGQVNAIIPSASSGKTSVEVRVETFEGSSNSFHIPAADACPAIFQFDAEGRAAALNQDGSVNSVHTPAVAGSVLAFFVTGLGGYTPGVEPQRVAPLEEPFPVASQPIQASLDGVALNIEYAGVAPGLVAAVSQLNLRLPEDAEPGARVIRLEAAGCSGASGLIEVRAASVLQAP